MTRADSSRVSVGTLSVPGHALPIFVAIYPFGGALAGVGIRGLLDPRRHDGPII